MVNWETKYSHIEVGDKVRVTRYVIGRLYPDARDDPDTVGKLFLVCEITPLLWRSSGKVRGYSYKLRRLEQSLRYPFTQIDSDDSQEGMELISKGDGTCIPGVHYQLNEKELVRQRWDAFDAVHKTVDYRHNDWSNAASWMANMYLTQEKRHADAILQMKRKDGTVNPAKIEKYFYRSGLRLEDWVFKCKLDVPEEFGRWGFRVRTPTMPDWQEIADEFAASWASQ
jgi:hypothetical protein